MGGGNLWREVDDATYPFGLAVPRKYGLTIDNLLSEDVVLPDGRFVWRAPPMCGIVWCYAADKYGEGQSDSGAVAELSETGVRVSWPDSASDAASDVRRGLSPGSAVVLESGFRQRTYRSGEHGSRLPTMHSGVHLYAVNGAAHRVGNRDTCSSYRDATFSQVMVGVDPATANRERIMHCEELLRRGASVRCWRCVRQLHDGQCGCKAAYACGREVCRNTSEDFSRNFT